MEILRLLEVIRTPVLTTFFQLCTLLGEGTFLIVIICCLYWCLNKNLAYKLAFTYFISGLCVQTLKITFRIPRPWILDPDFHPVSSATATATGYSFPSGHTQAGSSLFTILGIYNRNKLIRSLCGAAVLLIGFSRMYLGVHTPKDVLVSMIISVGISFFVYYFIDKYMHDKFCDKKISLILGTISILVLLYASFLVQTNTIDVLNAKDCFKSAGAGLAFAFAWYLERTYINFKTEAPLGVQAAKLVTGLSLALLLKTALKAVLGNSLMADFSIYFILVFWVTVIFPWLIKKYFQNTHPAH